MYVRGLHWYANNIELKKTALWEVLKKLQEKSLWGLERYGVRGKDGISKGEITGAKIEQLAS